MKIRSFLFLPFFLSTLILVSNHEMIFGQYRENEFTDGGGKPYFFDNSIDVELVADGLELPTNIAFLAPNDFLVLEKDKGTVQRIVDGKIMEKPLLDVNVATYVERCMCGIAVSKNELTTYVFLYFTEIDGNDGSDRDGKNEPIGNRIYRYELINNELVNPVLLLDLPSKPGPRHNGGAITIGPDNNLYIPIGDVDGTYQDDDVDTLAQNNEDGKKPDGRAGILRITQDGDPVGNGILGDEYPTNLYYAYGIRNSFGIGFDPISGYLWDTENGPGNSDEINLVEPGFNSGWQPIMGMSSSKDDFEEDELFDFDGKGIYSDPELVWINTSGPTAITFMNSDVYGQEYKNDMFVSDVHFGYIYHFDLTEDRKELVLKNQLANKIIKGPKAPGIEQIIFAKNFGGITDIEISPDGYLYVASIAHGKIFKIVPK
ncbi:MAG: quinoprotein glucose dehydrogenase [Nitrososphaeraceae archaeon]|nr:quinoprotein glucose dehydrogenase [Nitrososphaeraceae archaeon]